tara:strand:- start:2250 stop:2774 length:525 start_codon:yes stop_codon:yes gene_type:complete
MNVNAKFKRVVNDWYVEPAFCVDALMDSVSFDGDIHDPCCGQGNIPKITGGTGSDLVDRSEGRYPVVDFLKDKTKRENIITNPPYRITVNIVTHALKHVQNKIAVIVPLGFLASLKRFDFFRYTPVDEVLIMSHRPSMPPGGTPIKLGKGSTDYCWIVWNNSKLENKPVIRWII